MTQNLKKYGLIMLFFAAGSMASIGCVPAEINNSDSSDAKISTEVSADETSETGCCGQCATEQNVTEKAEGCCGKCADEASPAAAKKTKTECKACANGDSNNCKCDHASDEKSNIEKVKQSTSAINSMSQDRDIFHFLLQNHDKIKRTATEIENGVKTVTESTDPAIVSKIQEHVVSMQSRVEDGRPLRMWDDLYREIFKHADKIKMEVKKTKNGVAVTETSDDPYVVKLIQSHAKVVTGFSQKGFDEARLNHEPPKK